jgi:hypothetical protein
MWLGPAVRMDSSVLVGSRLMGWDSLLRARKVVLDTLELLLSRGQQGWRHLTPLNNFVYTEQRAPTWICRGDLREMRPARKEEGAG